jgi:hypothetical protein
MSNAEPAPTDATAAGRRVAERLADPAYLEGLEGRPLEWIRAERGAISALEDQISYVRRLVQGRLDILSAEQRRRAAGGEHDLSSLVDDLPGILAEGGHSGISGRLSAVLDPGEVDAELVARMAAAAPDRLLTGLTEASDEELATAHDRLAGLEHDVSQQRRACHGALDRLGAEMVRRYRDGEANVDTLLS